MISKPVVLGLLAAGCVTAAAGGAYVAVRQNAAESSLAAPAALAAPAPSGLSPGTQPSAAVPVAETEAQVAPSTPEAAPELEAQPERRPETPAAPRPRVERPVERRTSTARRDRAIDLPVASRPPERRVENPDAPLSNGSEGTPAVAAPQPEPVLADPVRLPDVAPAPAAPEFVELIVPAASVIGLQVETPLSTERARVEDRVEARVTRDVTAANRIAIPAGARVVGAVTLVERGGKIKERARLGVRFHTLVLADGTEIPIRTDAIYREGEAPGRESSAKIGGAAVGGAIIGAILGGGKGAAIGGATGAAGGTAAVMAGDRNAATLPAGTVLTVRLTEPVAVEVEKR